MTDHKREIHVTLAGAVQPPHAAFNGLAMPSSTFTGLLQPGDYVRNPLQPDWGLGQIQSIIGSRITVNFEHQGKLLIDGAEVELAKVDAKDL